MRDTRGGGTTRRGFLEAALVTLGASSFVPRLHAARAGSDPAAQSTSPYLALNREEAAFTEAMVSARCPADHLTPDGAACGLALAVDRELADGAGIQLRRFKAGVVAANRESRARFGTAFDELAPDDARRLLQSDALAAWNEQVVNPLLVQACFVGPIYEGYCNRVFWKLFGHVTH